MTSPKISVLSLVWLTLLTAYPTFSQERCRSIVLPNALSTELEAEFSGWKIVTVDDLSSSDDRQFWKENFPSECPGIIKGHFRSQHEDYVINFIKGSGKTLEQQVVLFEVAHKNITNIVISAPSHVDVVTVLRKFAPGKYRSRETGRSVRIHFDTIGISEIEARTVVYYWDGRRFRSIITSV